MHRKPKNMAVPTTSSPQERVPKEITLNLNLRVNEFGARYGVAEVTVWRWVADGLPYLKLSPRHTRIPVVEADAWVKQRFSRKRNRR